MNPQLLLVVLNAAVALLAVSAVLGFQIHTYRKTRHRSSLILLTASILGIGCYVLMYLPWLAPRPMFSATPFLLLVSALFLAQAVLNVWGSAELFSAFRRFYSSATARSRDATMAAAPATDPPVVILASELAADGPGPVPVQQKRASSMTDVLKLWVLRPLRGDPGRASDGFVAGLCLAALAIWTALTRWHVGAGAEFSNWNIPTLALYVLVPLGFAYLAARLSVPRPPLRAIVFAAAALMPLLAILAWLLETLEARRTAHLARLTLWLYVGVYMLVALRRVTGRWQPRVNPLLLALLGGCFALSDLTFWSADLWFAPEKNEAGEFGPRRDAAAMLFNQRAKIDEAVAAMAVEATPGPKVFFVGFAGVGYQRVFAEEIKFASHIIADRFGSGSRQLLLMNDRRDPDTYPIADTTSLAYGLKAVAGRMNLDRDVLVLSLSSHGGAKPVLSVSNGLLTLDQLSGEELVKALGASGIKRRVIIISACHAGAFIPALQTPNTIIITAAAADKTSFGCADDRDLTYFGKAFYRDAIPHAKSLESAFQEAKRAIAEREKREQQTPSDPQAYFGSELEPILTQIAGTPRDRSDHAQDTT